ncbi:glycosyltransferase [Geomonas sp. RF6]|uniref:glycosyltransferase family protein n=1 Tax=Geomonas sp. RF6 TaxID=2897342 RepID=UPI001E55EF13|nr:glycosyltransferase [Geomonas sp. RF6]UFS72429.1 glycosyltransferase [Geomonas sp. RF6]
MKFLQIVNFYSSYLDDFYAQRPGLAGEAYQKQLSALVADGFGGSHLFAPYLGEFGYDANLVIANCEPLQRRWLAENAPLQGCGDIMQVLLMQVEMLRPEIIYISDPICFDSRFVRALSYRPRLVLGWRAASVPAQTDWSDFDLILSNFKFGLELAVKHGARGREFFMPGFPPHIAQTVASEEKRHDVVFTGQVTGEHGARREVLNHASKALLTDDRSFSLAYFIPGSMDRLEAGIAMRNHGGVWGMDMYRTLRRGRIALNVQIDIGEDQAGNMRLFEATGSGSFLLTDYHPNISRYFEPGRELETYASPGELIEKVHHYLAHSEEREAIARRGQERCLREYSMQKRAAELDAIIRKYLPASVTAPSAAAAAPAEGAMARFEALQRQKEEALQRRLTSSVAKGPEVPAAPAPPTDDLAAAFPEVSFGTLVQVLGMRNISIGEGSCIGDCSWLNVCVRDEHVRLRIGRCVLVGRQGMISTGGTLEIGDYCVFAPRVYISDADHIYTDIMQPVIQQGATLNRRVVVEENCWLGINTVISGNLTVGRGSVIGANAVVTRDIPPFSVAVGNPAQIVKMYSPRTGGWERTRTAEDIERIVEERRQVGIPSREEYREILRRNALVTRLDPILTGRGNL